MEDLIEGLQEEARAFDLEVGALKAKVRDLESQETLKRERQLMQEERQRGDEDKQKLT